MTAYTNYIRKHFQHLKNQNQLLIARQLSSRLEIDYQALGIRRQIAWGVALLGTALS